jgi:multiple sugar transport system ATP-binding protein
MAAVDIASVVKAFGTTPVIHGVDLEVADGEFVVLVGPSGCGKSTLLRMIAGLESVTSGTIRIGDRAVNDLAPRDRDIAMVFQDYALYPHKSVGENIGFGLRMRGEDAVTIDRKVKEASEILQIGHLLDRKPGQLSGGQRQRVAMGRAIVRDPKVFLFDEPLSNLDAQLRAEMRLEIKKLHQRFGTTILYVTQDQVEAMTLADRIAVLSAGKLMQYDTPEAIYNRPAALFVAGFTGAPPMNLVDCTVVQGAADFGGVRFGLPADLAARSAGVPRLKFGVRPENLTLAATGDGSAALDAEVLMLEPLGAETLVTFRAGNAELVARCPASFHDRPGSRRTLHLQPGHMHLFNADSGAAL